MSLPSRIELFQQAINIEKERAVLEGKLAQLKTNLERIQTALFPGETGAPAPAKATPAAKPSAVTKVTKPVIKLKAASPEAKPQATKPAAKSKTASPAAKAGASAKAAAATTAQRAELKHRILSTLAAAGDGGMRVRDISKVLGVAQPALHSWFQFARKHNPDIKRADKGCYRFTGTPPEPPPAGAIAPAPRKKPVTTFERGQLTNLIQDELKAAGKDGVRVADLAKKFNATTRNLFVWFATTAKNFKEIKKLAPGVYGYEAS